jgi:hypothetical protein
LRKPPLPCVIRDDRAGSAIVRGFRGAERPGHPSTSPEGGRRLIKRFAHSVLPGCLLLAVLGLAGLLVVAILASS